MVVLGTCVRIVAGLVKFAREQFQSDDGVNDDDKEHEQRNVKQADHGA